MPRFFEAALDDMSSPAGRARVYADPDGQDTLERIADDLIARYAAAARPRIVMLGAYADPEHGCVTAFWKHLVSRGVDPDRIEVHESCLTAGPVMATPNGQEAICADGPETAQ